MVKQAAVALSGADISAFPRANWQVEKSTRAFIYNSEKIDGSFRYSASVTTELGDDQVSTEELNAAAQRLAHCDNHHDKLVSILDGLLKTTEMNLDDLEPGTRELLQSAHQILAAAQINYPNDAGAEKYYIGSIFERNGDREYIHHRRFQTSGDPARYLDRVTSVFLGAPDEGADNGHGYYFHRGSFYAEPQSHLEVSATMYHSLEGMMEINDHSDNQLDEHYGTIETEEKNKAMLAGFGIALSGYDHKKNLFYAKALSYQINEIAQYPADFKSTFWPRPIAIPLRDLVTKSQLCAERACIMYSFPSEESRLGMQSDLHEIELKLEAFTITPPLPRDAAPTIDHSPLP